MARYSSLLLRLLGSGCRGLLPTKFAPNFIASGDVLYGIPNPLEVMSDYISDLHEVDEEHSVAGEELVGFA
jgi:hypothetical protein